MTVTEQDTETRAVIEAFNEAFGRHDVDAIMALMTDDCVFENTFPAPDGERYEGQAPVRAFWTQFFAQSPAARIDAEDLFVSGDRAAMPWRYSWVDAHGAMGHVRGVDIFRVRDGKVAEKFSYVKG
jgi:ketosteroid isomerase-like protein